MHRSVPASLATLALLLLPARADDAPAERVRGRVRLGGWIAPERERHGVDLGGRVELTPRCALELFAARSEGEGGPADLGWGRLDLGWFRVAGGLLADEDGRADGGVHVGFAPAGRVELHRTVALEGGLDLSLGAGFLGGDRRPRTGRRRDLYPDPVDLLAAGLLARVELQVRPVERLLIAFGARAAGTAVAGPPIEGQVPGSLEDVAREVDLGLFGALSRGDVGGWGRVQLAVWRGGLWSAPAAVTLSYVEAWDWIHLDPIYTVLQLEDDDLRLEPVPWRQTRTAELGLGWGTEARRLELALDVRHVIDSTTLESQGERNGWSIGARLAARWERLLVTGQVRWALRRDAVEEVVGELSRVRASARVGWLLLDGEDLALRTEVGVEAGLSDELGLLREGLAFTGGLALELGGAGRGPFPDPQHDPFARALRVSAAPRVATGPLVPGAPPPPLFPARELAGLPDADGVAALLGQVSPEELARAFGLDEVPDPDQVEAWLRARPELLDQLEDRYPGAADAIDDALDRMRAAADAPPPPPSGALVLGHALPGPRLALVSSPDGGTTLDALTLRLDGTGPEEAGRERLRQLDLGLGSHRSFTAWAGSEGLEKLTILHPRTRAPWLQTSSAWSRAMHRFLTGR